MINLKNFRIKKVTTPGGSEYYPQEKLLGLFWIDIDMFTRGPYDGGHAHLEYAQEALCKYLWDRNPVVEYLEVECPCDE